MPFKRRPTGNRETEGKNPSRSVALRPLPPKNPNDETTTPREPSTGSRPQSTKSSTTKEPNPQSVSPLFKLPLELRLQIYTNLLSSFGKTQHIHLPASPTSPINLSASRIWSPRPPPSTSRSRKGLRGRFGRKGREGCEDGEKLRHTRCVGERAAYLSRDLQRYWGPWGCNHTWCQQVALREREGEASGWGGTGGVNLMQGGWGRGVTAMLRSCRRMYAELGPLLYSTTTFSLIDLPATHRFLTTLSQPSSSPRLSPSDSVLYTITTLHLTLLLSHPSFLTPPQITHYAHTGITTSPVLLETEKKWDEVWDVVALMVREGKLKELRVTVYSYDFGVDEGRLLRPLMRVGRSAGRRPGSVPPSHPQPLSKSSSAASSVKAMGPRSSSKISARTEKQIERKWDGNKELQSDLDFVVDLLWPTNFDVVKENAPFRIEALTEGEEASVRLPFQFWVPPRREGVVGRVVRRVLCRRL